MYKAEIPVFFTIDDSYAPYLGVALTSMKENASLEYDYKIIVVEQKLSDVNRRKLQALEEPGFSISFVRMDAVAEKITDREENRLRCDYFTLTIYYRLFIADMFPQYDRAIYIDSDVVIPGDISKLYEINLGECLIGACPDYSISDVPELVQYTGEAVGMETGKYINSGVLLLNLKKMREVKLADHFLGLLDRHHFNCIAPDQDYLNAMCNGKILYLDRKWDAMPVRGREPLKDPQIIHYNLFEKPWCYSGVAYEDIFWSYAKRTAFYEEIREFKENYGEDQRRSDSRCMKLLIEKAHTIPKTEVTFRKIKERGERISL